MRKTGEQHRETLTGRLRETSRHPALQMTHRHTYIIQRDREQETQLMLTNPRDAFRGQSTSPNIVPIPFHMLGIVSY